MIIYDHIAQMTDEWFELKKGIPSASGASKVVSVAGKIQSSAAMYCDELIEAMLGLTSEKDKFKSEDLDRGIEYEAEARGLFEMETGMEIREVAWITNDAGSAGCSPDGLIELPGAGMGWETKCPKARTHIGYRRMARPYLMKEFGRFELYTAEALPTKYKQQCHWSMAITGLQRWYFQSHHPKLPPLYVLVKADAYTVKVRSAINQFTESMAQEIESLGVEIPQRKAA